jgi:hypothetical protein
MTNERRSRPRTNLRTPLFLIAPECSELIETQTENIGMDGFFCCCRCLLPPGTRLRFLLKLSPASVDTLPTQSVYLEGLAEVVHVSSTASVEGFGLGCHFTGYRVLPEEAIGSREDLAALLSRPYATNAEYNSEEQTSAALRDRVGAATNRL